MKKNKDNEKNGKNVVKVVFCLRRQLIYEKSGFKYMSSVVISLLYFFHFCLYYYE